MLAQHSLLFLLLLCLLIALPALSNDRVIQNIPQSAPTTFDLKLAPPQSGMAQQDRVSLQRLSKYDIVLMIDCSGSMARYLSSMPQRKWRWCQNNIVSFAQRIRPFVGDTITLVTFNDNYRVLRNCTPEAVESTFTSTYPNGDTNIASPLDAILREYLFSPRSRPLLIAIMTDGQPNHGGSVSQVIISASQQMRYPGEIKITFLEVGEEFEGRSFLKFLDDSLISQGARYDIVDTLTFDQVRSMGLVNALAHAISQ